MQYGSLRKNQMLVLVLAGILATASPALAEKPFWAGGGKKDNKHEKSYKEENREDHGRHGGTHAFFGERQMTVIRSYYLEKSRSGHCPPGLTRKNNGCMPPGHARKWAVGRSLPRDVVFYDLPPEVVIRLGPPPERHRYARVAGDIQLIAVGTGMVVDAIQDLGNL